MAATVTEREREVLRLNEEAGDSEETMRWKIRRVLRDYLGDDAIRDDDDIMESGLDSLGTVAVIGGICNALKVQLSPSTLFDAPSISALARAVHEGWAVAAPFPVETEPGVGRKLVFGEFTQLVVDASAKKPLGSLQLKAMTLIYEQDKYYDTRYQRATDGMKCILMPAESVWVGDGRGGRAALPNEQPCHKVRIKSFLIDVEPVCAGAYARFLNCVQAEQEQISDWIGLRPGDLRERHTPLFCAGDGVWRPKAGFSPKWPMIMVSWYGANAYSLWANGQDWRDYRDASQSFLPTEAQWEYAARGVYPSNFPWGNMAASEDLLVFCPDEKRLDPDMRLEDFPLQPVTAELGVSLSGLRGMAGNVWQWCRDKYDAEFYKSREASRPNAWNSAAGDMKSERGGSWVGPASVARSSYRRGRRAGAKGRCLGFRCVGDPHVRMSAPAAASHDTAATEGSLSTEAHSAACGDTVSTCSEPSL